MLRAGDLSMVKVWAGLEARKFLQASVHSVEMCVKIDAIHAILLQMIISDKGSEE